jgi:hypothetical protein
MGVDGAGNKNSFAKIYEESFEAIAPYLISSIKDRLTALTQIPDLNQTEKEKQTVVILQHALPQVEEIDSLISGDTFMKAQSDDNPVGYDMLYTVGGYLLRTVNGQIYKPILNLIDKQWTDFVAGIISQRTKVDSKKANSLAEYFTGKKEVPNYNEMTKAAKNLLAAEIDFDIFKEILDISNDWFEDTLSTEFSSFKTDDGTFTGEFLQAALKTIEKIQKKPKEIQKYLDKAIVQYTEDIAYQIAFRNLSQHETKSGD